MGKGTTSTARARRVTSASSKWRGLSYGSIVFLAIVVLEALAVIGLVVSVFAIVEVSWELQYCGWTKAVTQRSLK